jgi:hypothetical protein
MQHSSEEDEQQQFTKLNNSNQSAARKRPIRTNSKTAATLTSGKSTSKNNTQIDRSRENHDNDSADYHTYSADDESPPAATQAAAVTSTPLPTVVTGDEFHYLVLGYLAWILVLVAFIYANYLAYAPYLQNSSFAEWLPFRDSPNTPEQQFYNTLPASFQTLNNKYTNYEYVAGIKNTIEPVLLSHFNPHDHPSRPAVLNLMSLNDEHKNKASQFKQFVQSLSNTIFNNTNSFVQVDDKSLNEIDRYIHNRPDQSGIIYLDDLSSINAAQPKLQHYTDDAAAPYKRVIYVFTVYIPKQFVADHPGSRSEELVRAYLRSAWKSNEADELIDPLLNRIVRNVIVFP